MIRRQRVPSKFGIAALCVVLLILFNQEIFKRNFNYDGSLPKIYENGCHLNNEEYVPKPCIFGDTKSKFTIVLVGDSHAAQFFPAFEQFAITEGFKFISWTKSSCPFADFLLNANCIKWNNSVVKRINEVQPNILITSNSLVKNYSSESSFISTISWVNGVLNQLEEIELSD